MGNGPPNNPKDGGASSLTDMRQTVNNRGTSDRGTNEKSTSSVSPEEKIRQEMQKLLPKGTLNDWLKAVRPMKFLGIQIIGGVHEELRERLEIAEKSLRGKSYQPLRSISGFQGIRSAKSVTPAKRTGPSMHNFGLAIDINYPTNVWFGYVMPRQAVEIVKRATDLVIGRSILVNCPAKSTDYCLHNLHNKAKAMQRYDELQEASDALAKYFALYDKRDEIKSILDKQKKPNDASKIEAILKQIRSDLQLARQHPRMFGASPEKTGFMDLNRELVKALVQANLSWGGMYYDIMHFDYDQGTYIPPKRKCKT